VASLAIEPLPEQALGSKRARHSSSDAFSWLSILATVEDQLMLRCLDVRSRLTAARCNKQLYAAASHPFAWPQAHMATLWVDNDASALRSFGEQVRRSLLRFTTIRLHVGLLNGSRLVCLEVFAVPNVRALTLQPLPSAGNPHAMALHFLCPLLRRPAAQQLHSLDLSRLWCHKCSFAEWQQLCTLRQLRSLSLGSVLGKDRFYVLKDLALLPSLSHLSLAHASSTPSSLLEPLSQLLTLAPLMQVELRLPLTFDEWHRQSINSVDQDLRDYQQREWDELQRLPARLPRVRIVEVEPENDE
jgi:hypothetical protein